MFSSKNYLSLLPQDIFIYEIVPYLPTIKASEVGDVGVVDLMLKAGIIDKEHANIKNKI